MNFGKQLEAYAKRKNIAMDKVIRAALLQVSSNIILRTPVDTGRARGNWQASIDNAAGGEVEHKQAAALAQVAASTADAPGRVYWLVNNLPYIGELEYGSSQQAPVGMLRVSLREFQDALQKAISQNK